MAKADQFHLAAETIATTIEDQDIAEAYVTLCFTLALAAIPPAPITRTTPPARAAHPTSRR